MYDYAIDKANDLSPGYSYRTPQHLRAFKASQMDTDSSRVPRFCQRPVGVANRTTQSLPSTPVQPQRKTTREETGLLTPSPTSSFESVEKKFVRKDSARQVESRPIPGGGLCWTPIQQYTDPDSCDRSPPSEPESPTLRLSFRPRHPLKIIDHTSPRLHQVIWRPAEAGSPKIRHYPGTQTDGFEANRAQIAAKKAELASLDQKLQDVTTRVEILQLLKVDLEKSPQPAEEVIVSTVDLLTDQNLSTMSNEGAPDKPSGRDLFTDARARSVSLEDFPPPPYSEPRRLSPSPPTATPRDIAGSYTSSLHITNVAASMPCTPVRKVEQGIKMVQVRRSPTRRDEIDNCAPIHHKDSQRAGTGSVHDIQSSGLLIEGLFEEGVRSGCPVAVSQVILPGKGIGQASTPSSRPPQLPCPSRSVTVRPAAHLARERQSSSWPPRNLSSQPRAFKPPPPRRNIRAQAKHDDPFYVSHGSNPMKWTVHNLPPAVQRGETEPPSIGTVSRPREWSIIGPHRAAGSEGDKGTNLSKKTRTSQHITNFSVQKKRRSRAQLMSRARQYSQRSFPLIRKMFNRSAPPTRIDPSRLRLEAPRLTSSGFGLEQAILDELRMRSEKSRDLFRRSRARAPSRPISIRTLRRNEICWPSEQRCARSGMNSVDLKNALNGSHSYYGFIPTLRPTPEKPKRTLSQRLVRRPTPSTLHWSA